LKQLHYSYEEKCKNNKTLMYNNHNMNLEDLDMTLLLKWHSIFQWAPMFCILESPVELQQLLMLPVSCV
jgi:hypothetical protein